MQHTRLFRMFLLITHNTVNTVNGDKAGWPGRLRTDQLRLYSLVQSWNDRKNKKKDKNFKLCLSN